MYSGALPPSLAKVYEALLEDEALLSLRHEIAATRAWLADRMRRLHQGEAVGRSLLRQLLDCEQAWKVFDAARHGGKPAGVKQAVEAMGQALEKAFALAGPQRQEQECLAEFLRVGFLLDRFVRDENVRADEIYTRISAERAFALRQAETTVFLEAIDQHVPDSALNHAIRQSVATKFAELAHRRDHQTLVALAGSSVTAGDSQATK